MLEPTTRTISHSNQQGVPSKSFSIDCLDIFNYSPLVTGEFLYLLVLVLALVVLCTTSAVATSALCFFAMPWEKPRLPS